MVRWSRGADALIGLVVVTHLLAACSSGSGGAGSGRRPPAPVVPPVYLDATPDLPTFAARFARATDLDANGFADLVLTGDSGAELYLGQAAGLVTATANLPSLSVTTNFIALAD